MAAVIAWGEPALYATPDHQHVWGRAFEILPPTSLDADGILRGVIGRRVALAGTGTEPEILVCGTGLTTAQDLLPFQQQLADELLLPTSG
jgi:hypothetical protein